MSERQMLDLVHRRFSQDVNGLSPRYIVAEHVRFDPTSGYRTLDAIVQDTWPSDAYAVHGIEIKCSRSDLRRELNDLSKSERFSDHVDYFWLAVSDDKIIKGLDLPENWGILTVRGSSLRAVRKAPRLRHVVSGYVDREPLPRSVQVAMLRATRKTYERLTQSPTEDAS